MIGELIEMRAQAAPGSISRRLAERCLELCFQEVTANDEHFPPISDSAAEELARVIGSAWF
jgi:hypothetical protein